EPRRARRLLSGPQRPARGRGRERAMNLYDLQAIMGILLPIAGPAIGAVYTWWATRSREAEKKVETLRADAFKAIEELQAHANTVDQKIGSLDQFVRSLP